MRSMTGRLLVLISGLTLLSVTAERSYAEQGCRGCDVRTAVTINREANGEVSDQLFERVDQRDQIMDKYEHVKEKHDWIKNALLIFGLTADEVASEIGDMSPPLLGVPSVAVSGGEVLARFATAKVILHFTEKMDESARMILADGLEQYRQQHNGNFSGLLEAYEQGEIPVEGIFDPPFGEHPVYDTRLDDVRPEDQHVVNKFMIRSLADSVGKGMESINNLLREYDAAIVANQVDIARNRRNLTLMAQAFNRYVDEANERFTRLETNQRELYEVIENNRHDIVSVQVVLFNTLSPKQQLQALEGSFFRDMPKADRKALEREVQDAANQQETLEDVIWISRGIGELVRIARNLGVDEEITEPVVVAAEVGISTAVAYASFQTGNIPQGIVSTLQGIAVLTGLLGEDKPDPVIENQKKLAEMLRAVMGGLEHIDKKLDKLFENQQKILGNQRKIYDLLAEIGKDIQVQYEDLADRIYSLNTDVLVNRKLIRERVAERIRVCDGMRRDYANENVYNEIQDNLEGYLKYGIFPDYQDIRKIIQASNPINNGCYEQLFGIFPDTNDPPHSYFELETYKEIPSDITPDDYRVNVEKIGNFLGLIYNPSVQLVDHYYTVDRGLSRQQLLSVLSLPVMGLQALDQKHDRAKHLPSSEPYPFEALKFEDLEDALSPDVILKVVWLLLDIYPLYHFVDNEGSPLPIDELKGRAHTGRLYNTPGEKWLEQAKDVVEAAIAQQALLAGDMLLPVIYEKLHRVSSTREKEKVKEIRLLLQKNPLLARNFMLYLVHRQLNRKIPVLAYDTAIMEGNLTDYQKRDMINVLRTLYEHNGGHRLSISASDWSLIDEWLAEQIRPIQQQVHSVRQSLNELDRTDIRIRSKRSNELYDPDREDQHGRNLGIRAYLIDDRFYKQVEDLKKTWYEVDPRDLNGIYNVDLARVIFNVLMTHKDNNILRTLLINQWLQKRYRHVTGGEVQYGLLSSRITLENSYLFKDKQPKLAPESEACQRPEGSPASPHRPHAQFHLTKPIWLYPVYHFPPAPSVICDEEHHYPHCASCFLFYSGEIDNRIVALLGSTYADVDNLRSRWRRRLLTSTDTLQGDVHKGLLDQLDAWLREEESMEGIHMAMSHDGAGVWVSEPEPGSGRRFKRYYEFMSHDGMNARVKALTDEGLRQGDAGLLQVDAWLKEQYRLALENNDGDTLRLILDKSVRHAELVRHFFEQEDGNRDEKWALKWGDDLYLPLPEADDLITDKLLHTPEMSKLIDLRSYIIEEIIGRQFVGNEDGLLDDSEYQLFNDLLFLHAAESPQELLP